MSSREIADLVDSRHDKVKQSIERLAERGVISLHPMGEVKIQRERRAETVQVYNLCKRDSLIVVAQLCPEFTARIVDRWQELEAQQAARLNLFLLGGIDGGGKHGVIASDCCSRRTHSVSISFDAGNPAHGFSEAESFRQPIPSRS